MRNIVLILLIALGFLSCKKEQEEITTVNEKYIIELDQNDVIHKVTHHKAGNLNYVLEFTYTDDYVRSVTHNSANALTNTKQYYLSNGLCDSLVDSTFTNGLFKSANTSLFEYKSGYKFKKKYISASVQGFIITEYFYMDGNLTRFIVMDNCTGNYTFSNHPSKINIMTFVGDYMGKQNSKLNSGYSPGGCPSGPSTVFSNDSYTYTLNSEDYVIERVNIHTASHHSSDDNPAKKRTISQYEYVFR